MLDMMTMASHQPPEEVYDQGTRLTGTSSMPSRPVHFTRAPELRLRTRGDISPDAFREHSLSAMLLEAQHIRPKKPSLIGTADGRIAQMLLTVPAYVVQTKSYRVVYEDLVAKLPEDMDLVVLTHESIASTVEAWMRTWPSSTTTLPTR